MAVHEANAMKGDIYTSGKRLDEAASSLKPNPKGKVIDLIFPVIVLVICCITGMIYTGGFFSGTSFVESFSQSDASIALSIGSLIALVITVIFYSARRVLVFRSCMECIPEGFKAMVPAILILTFAWTLKAMTDSLGAADFVEMATESAADSLMNENSDPTLMIISISACMAGAVCGDHCSPISDTTIMASAGAQCDHVNHVSTQLPYAMLAAAISFVTYIVAGFVKVPWIPLPIGILLLLAVLFLIKQRQK